MRKLIWLIILVFFAVGCSSQENTNGPEEPIQSEQNVDQSISDEDNESVKLSAKAGVGSSKDTFIKDYGPMNTEDAMPRFGSVHVMFGGHDLASTVFLFFDKTDKPRRPQKEALDLGKELLPVDAEFVKQYDVENEKTVYVFKSNLLKELNAKKYFADDARDGICSIVMEYDEGKKDQVYTVYATVGDNP